MKVPGDLFLTDRKRQRLVELEVLEANRQVTNGTPHLRRIFLVNRKVIPSWNLPHIKGGLTAIRALRFQTVTCPLHWSQGQTASIDSNRHEEFPVIFR